VSLPGEVAVARGDQDLTSVMAGLRLAHDFGNTTWYLRPQVDLTGTYLRLGSIKESSEYAGDLRARPESGSYVAVQPALELGGEVEMLNATLIRPFARVGITELLTDSEIAADALFDGTPSGVASFSATHDFEDSYVDASLGIDVLFTNGASARVVYGGQFADESREDTATVKFRIPF
jgi:outer membrane autotransporter protein